MSNYGHDEAMADLDYLATRSGTLRSVGGSPWLTSNGWYAYDRLAAYIERLGREAAEANCIGALEQQIEQLEQENKEMRKVLGESDE